MNHNSKIYFLEKSLHDSSGNVTFPKRRLGLYIVGQTKMTKTRCTLVFSYLHPNEDIFTKINWILIKGLDHTTHSSKHWEHMTQPTENLTFSWILRFLLPRKKYSKVCAWKQQCALSKTYLHIHTYADEDCVSLVCACVCVCIFFFIFFFFENRNNSQFNKENVNCFKNPPIGVISGISHIFLCFLMAKEWRQGFAKYYNAKH